MQSVEDPDTYYLVRWSDGPDSGRSVEVPRLKAAFAKAADLADRPGTHEDMHIIMLREEADGSVMSLGRLHPDGTPWPCGHARIDEIGQCVDCYTMAA
jgi:hypothetical protein